jgi:hypothetical protein
MKTIKVKIPTDKAALVQQYLDEARHLDGSRLTVEELVEMLLDDVALMVTRPGCWEAAAMDGLLSSHGYQDGAI